MQISYSLLGDSSPLQLLLFTGPILVFFNLSTPGYNNSNTKYNSTILNKSPFNYKNSFYCPTLSLNVFLCIVCYKLNENHHNLYILKAVFLAMNMKIKCVVNSENNDLKSYVGHKDNGEVRNGCHIGTLT